MTTPAGSPDQTLERLISRVLLVGVLLAATVLLLGGSLYLWRHGGEPVPDRGAFAPEPAEYSRPREILRAALAGQGRAIIQLGLVMLIATPVARVAVSAVVLARRRDVVYALVALFVLGVLLVGLFGGLAGH